MILRLAYQESDPVINPYLDDIRSHDYSRSFSSVRDFIKQNSDKRRDPNKRRFRITWVLVILLPFLIFFSCKQKTYKEPQGATLSFTATDSAQSRIDFVIQQYADKTLRVVLRSHAGTIHGTFYAPTDSSSKLKAIAEKLKAITGVNEIYLSAMSTTVKESPLSRLSYNIFNRHVDATGATDEQLRTEIEGTLQKSGLLNLKVELITDGGKKKVKFVSKGKGVNFSINLTLRDGTNVTGIGWYREVIVKLELLENYSDPLNYS